MPLGTQGKFQTISRKVFSFLNSVVLKDGPKACRCKPTQPVQPEDWKGQRPIQPKGPREEASSRWISNEESPHCTGVTPQRPCTPAQPPLQLHCPSGGHWGWSKFLVVGFSQVVGQVGRSVAQSVEVTPKMSKERGEWSQRLQGQSPTTSQRLERQSLKSPVDLAESGWTSEGFLQFVHKVQSSCLIQ